MEPTFTVSEDSPVLATVVVSQQEVKLGSLERFRLPLLVTVERSPRVPFIFMVRVRVTDQASGRPDSWRLASWDRLAPSR